MLISLAGLHVVALLHCWNRGFAPVELAVRPGCALCERALLRPAGPPRAAAACLHGRRSPWGARPGCSDGGERHDQGPPVQGRPLCALAAADALLRRRPRGEHPPCWRGREVSAQACLGCSALARSAPWPALAATLQPCLLCPPAGVQRGPRAGQFGGAGQQAPHLPCRQAAAPLPASLALPAIQRPLPVHAQHFSLVLEQDGAAAAAHAATGALEVLRSFSAMIAKDVERGEVGRAPAASRACACTRSCAWQLNV